MILAGEIYYQGVFKRLDARDPYVVNSNGKSYVRVEYSEDIHVLLIDEGVWKMPPTAQFTYIRDLKKQIKG